MNTTTDVNRRARHALDAGEGLLRLAPTWVPRSYLVPGRRLKLDARDLFAYGAHRGGIDERWIASTTLAMNENRTPDEGLSYVVAVMVLQTTDDFSWEPKHAADQENRKLREWETKIWKYQKPLPQARPGEKWILMEKIFQID